MKRYFLVSILLLAGVLTSLSMAQTLSGKVTDSRERPIDGATVVLQRIDSTFVDAAVTDTAGFFSLNQVPEHYRLIFQHIHAATYCQ